MEKEMATHSSILAWKSPWTEEPGGLQSMGLHDWACVHEGGGRWVGSNKLAELKKKKKNSGGLVSKSCLTLLWHHELQCTRLHCPWDFPGKNTGAGCHFPLQGIVSTQGSNLGLLNHRWSPALQVDSSLTEAPGKPPKTVSHSEVVV